MRTAILLLSLCLLTGARAPRTQPDVPYPEGYREWTHVKSTMVAPTHPTFATMGGFQHVYANAEAMTGYRTHVFPDRAVVVFEWLELRDSAGAYREGPRRQLDVMMKDTIRYRESGGWGFQRFARDSKTEHAATPTPAQCFACHQHLRKEDLVLSAWRE